LIQHEWAKHGTCSGLSTQDYFGALEKLYNGLEVPSDFQNPSTSAQTSPADIEQKFAKANNAPKGAFRISCPQNKFSAVEICLTKELQYEACPNTVKECRAKRIEVLSVP
jgi:ribonuclease T2